MGALFVCLWIYFPGMPSAQASQTCASTRFDEIATVARVTDGDTLRLQDGRAVRLIGINAPELGHDDRPAEPMAKQARDALKAMLGRGARVGLQYGREKHDRYRRLLAHVYLPGGESVQARLLVSGMVAQIVVPPNLGRLACYRKAEQQARKGGKGVWRGIYRAIPVESLGPNSRGFKRITGRISRIGESRKSVWLNFTSPDGDYAGEQVAVRIARHDLPLFTSWQPQSLAGKKVVVRGWLTAYRRQLVMRVRHPAGIEIVR